MEFQELIVSIAKIFEKLKIPYAITGGYATSIWGRLRATFDIDVVIELSISGKEQFTQAMKKLAKVSLLDEDELATAIKNHGGFNFIHGDSGIKIDFFVTGDDDFSRTKLERRIPQVIEEQTVYFLSPEDLILSKLLWCKDSGSELQLDDVKSIIELQKGLDWDYLWKWSAKQSTKNMLEKLKNKNVV